MLIGFDASRAFVKEYTGTENYSLNLLKALAKAEKQSLRSSSFDKLRTAGLRKNRYRVYVRKFSTGSNNILRAKSRRKWPSNFEFKVIRPNRLWTQVGLALETWKNPVDLLFVPAHTLPILRRRKIINLKLQNPKSNRNKPFFGIWKLVIGILSFLSKETRYVVTIHDLGVEYLPGYHQFPQKYYLDLASKYASGTADAIIAVSEATCGDLIKRYGIEAKKVHVVPEGVDTGFFKPVAKSKVESVKSKYKIRGKYILFVGTIQPRKNLKMLIEAFAEVVNRLQTTDYSKKTVDRRLSTLHLVIAGKLGWDYQEILDAPKKFGIEDSVLFLNYVKRQDLPALYTGCSLFAFPSLFEGFGLPILEALACGCRVIASDIAPHQEIYDKLQTPSSKLQTPNSKKITKLGIGNTKAYFRKTEKWKLEIASSKELGVPMILAKPNSVDEWVSILYQTISYSNNAKNIKFIRNTLVSNYSWIKAAIASVKVFESELG